MLLTAVALLVASQSRAALAQTVANVVGTWTLVSSVIDRDGTKTDQFDSGAKGMLVLDANGRFMLTIIGADLPKFASNNRASGTSKRCHGQLETRKVTGA